jgi:hypothetical protein
MEAISRADFDNNLIIRQDQGPTLNRAKPDSSDILICGHIGENFGQDIDEIEGFLAKGGTAVFFVSRDMSLPTTQRLYDAGVVGAEPTELIDERHVLSGPWPSDSIFAYAGLDVEQGGFVLMDDCVAHGPGDFFYHSSCQLLEHLFGKADVKRISTGHEIFHNIYDLSRVGMPYIQGTNWPPRGIFIEDRLAVLLTSTDIHCGWADRTQTWFGPNVTRRFGRVAWRRKPGWPKVVPCFIL